MTLWVVAISRFVFVRKKVNFSEKWDNRSIGKKKIFKVVRL